MPPSWLPRQLWGSAPSEPTGCPWQMASLWSSKGPCHAAADVGMTRTRRHTAQRALGAGAGRGGAGVEVGAPAATSLSLFKIKHLCAKPPSPKWGPLQIAPRRGCLREGLGRRPGCRHVAAAGLRRQLWVGWNEVGCSSRGCGCGGDGEWGLPDAFVPIKFLAYLRLPL